MQFALPTNRHFSKGNGDTEMNKNKVSAFTELAFLLNSILLNRIKEFGEENFFPIWELVFGKNFNI